MSKERPIHYETHPVSPQRKAELLGKGFRIVDMKFKPKDAPVSGTFEPTREGLDFAIAALPGEYVDPDFVVSGMSKHFGEVLTGEDETQIRKLVVKPVSKPSEGLKVGELKAALTEKGIVIPEGALKSDLAALLDEA